MKRQIKTLQPYPLTSDFELPIAPEPEHIKMTQPELAALLDQARDSTAELVRNDLLAAESEKLARAGDQLTAALSQIVALASHLENASIAELDRQTALDSVRKLASTMLEGQGELFSES